VPTKGGGEAVEKGWGRGQWFGLAENRYLKYPRRGERREPERKGPLQKREK